MHQDVLLELPEGFLTMPQEEKLKHLKESMEHICHIVKLKLSHSQEFLLTTVEKPKKSRLA